jgi:hypothetical protein
VHEVASGGARMLTLSTAALFRLGGLRLDQIGSTAIAAHDRSAPGTWDVQILEEHSAALSAQVVMRPVAHSEGAIVSEIDLRKARIDEAYYSKDELGHLRLTRKLRAVVIPR